MTSLTATLTTATLTTAPLASLIERLFEQDETSSPATSPAFANLSRDEITQMMQSKTDYLNLYGNLRDFPLAVSRSTAKLLYILARASNAKTVVEFGTSFGISTIHLAAALKDNGGGKLITSEFESSKVLKVHENLTEAGLIHLVEIREGDALKTLSTNLPDNIDLLLLDGAKSLYLDILKLVESRLKPGALIVADNADFSPEYLKHVRSTTSGYISIPFADDVELSMCIG